MFNVMRELPFNDDLSAIVFFHYGKIKYEPSIMKGLPNHSPVDVKCQFCVVGQQYICFPFMGCVWG